MIKQELMQQAEVLLKNNNNDQVIKILTKKGVPSDADQCALLAKAYFQMGDSKGDLFSANYFANRAIDFGRQEDWLKEIKNKYEHFCSAKKPYPKELLYEMGGYNELRDKKKTSYDFNALSVLSGYGEAKKDYYWLKKNIPCQEACPAYTDIPEYLTAIYNGDYEKAYRINLYDNVFPGVLGRVCARPCEKECRHGWEGLGDSVAICWSKRSAADLRKQDLVKLDKNFPKSGKKVVIIGSGVAGLTVARNLALCGHDVIVYEKHNKPGGMLNQGIPEFRLPREIINYEIEQIKILGVEIICNKAIGVDLSLASLMKNFDAVVMACGTLRRNMLDLPGKDLQGIRHGLDFLLEVNEKGYVDIGENVVVIGGGFTSMDCARTARRLGATTVKLEMDAEKVAVKKSILRIPKDKVKVWYRRSIKEMLVTPGELEELENEHIPMEFMVSPKAFIGENGYVKGMKFVRTEMGEVDSSGRRKPIEIPGSEFEVPIDTVLLATGQFPDCEWMDEVIKKELVEDDGWLKSGSSSKTKNEKIFVAGDFAQGASSLIQAIGHAKNTVCEVDAFLMKEERLVNKVKISDIQETGRGRWMDEVPLQENPTLPLTKRDLFAEVEQGFDNKLAENETQRCYRCNIKFEIDSDKCIYCDWCVKAKPRPECILKVKKLHYDDQGRVIGWDKAKNSDEVFLIWINQEDCIRCGACVDACPVDAISIQKVSLNTTFACCSSK